MQAEATICRLDDAEISTYKEAILGELYLRDCKFCLYIYDISSLVIPGCYVIIEQTIRCLQLIFHGFDRVK